VASRVDLSNSLRPALHLPAAVKDGRVRPGAPEPIQNGACALGVSAVVEGTALSAKK
jgi:hypothetical protein